MEWGGKGRELVMVVGCGGGVGGWCAWWVATLLPTYLDDAVLVPVLDANHERFRSEGDSQVLQCRRELGCEVVPFEVQF